MAQSHEKRMIGKALWWVIWITLVAIMTGCASDACLPEPVTDATPPEVRLQVIFTDPETGRQDSTSLTAQDPAPTVWADPAEAVVVVYEGVDPEGMKRLRLGVTIQQTVGIGVQTQTPVLEPVETSCPVEQLRGEQAFQGGQGERNLLVGVIAENWVEQRAITPSLMIRQREGP